MSRKERTYPVTCIASGYDLLSRVPVRLNLAQSSHYGLLQPLEMPEGPFHSISYDFITKLPLTPRGHDSICVFVDRFSKMAFFVPCNEKITAKGFAKLYVNHVQAT
jgi:hypothetical protein